MRKVTDRQLDILELVIKLTEQDNRPPTLKELSLAAGSTSVQSQIRSLRLHGLLDMERHKNRTMKVSPLGLERLMIKRMGSTDKEVESFNEQR